MRKYILLSVLSVALIAAGCKKEDEKTYDIPTESETIGDINTGSLTRVQTLTASTAAEISYTFDVTNISFVRQSWRIYFTTASKAATAGITYQLAVAAKPSTEQPNITYSENVVTVNFPDRAGPLSDSLNTIGDLAEVTGIIEKADLAAEFLKIFGVIQ